jgi:hypothetical protein
LQFFIVLSKHNKSSSIKGVFSLRSGRPSYTGCFDGGDDDDDDNNNNNNKKKKKKKKKVTTDNF